MKLKMNRSALAVANALACLATFGCGGVDDVSGLPSASQTENAERRRARAIDTIAPTVLVQSTGTPTADGLTSLAGIASDDFWIYKVRWATEHGDAGDAVMSGSKTTAQWSVASIPLQAGTNNITITAEDGAGHTTQVGVSVMWEAPAPAPVVEPSASSASSTSSPAAARPRRRRTPRPGATSRQPA